ncbi:MAG: 2'-deoxycytidine 5'-triphosphate deaminase [Alphaproteobacteria bacterium]|nr:2'-deoxycytidine 5'-triphosphate deaminase [Alphaproteobacteria bacterium]
MTATANDPAERRAAERAAGGSGVFIDADIEALAASGAIAASLPPGPGQVQPASVDLRLAPVAYRVRSSFLPLEGRSVRDMLDRYAMHTIDMTRGAVLERQCFYVVPLLESLALPRGLGGTTNPKSSTGRLDVFTRVICDGATGFDLVPQGYRGPLYAEISPKTFSIFVHEGSRLTQLRLRRGAAALSERAMREVQAATPLVHGPDAAGVESSGAGGRAPDAAATIKDNTIAVSVDLRGADSGGLIGYRARRHSAVIDLDRIGHYDAQAFWEPIHAEEGGGLILDPGEFYILASKERVSVPPSLCAEMVAYDVLNGEFRVHYAGFFDPGFGWPDGTRAVLEVRSHEVPFLLEHGQIVGRLAYERLTGAPNRIYGQDIGSSYAHQGLALSKHFRK